MNWSADHHDLVVTSDTMDPTKIKNPNSFKRSIELNNLNEASEGSAESKSGAGVPGRPRTQDSCIPQEPGNLLKTQYLNKECS